MAMVQAVAVETNEGGQLTERLAGHAQQAPLLDAWLAKFPTLRQGLPAQQNLAEVATAVDGVAKQILASKAGAAAIKVSRHCSDFAQQCAPMYVVQHDTHTSLQTKGFNTGLTCTRHFSALSSQRGTSSRRRSRQARLEHKQDTHQSVHLHLANRQQQAKRQVVSVCVAGSSSSSPAGAGFC